MYVCEREQEEISKVENNQGKIHKIGADRESREREKKSTRRVDDERVVNGDR